MINRCIRRSIFADETVVPALDPGRGRTKQGYFWAIARDHRPWGGGDSPTVVYNYAPGRGHTHANALLGGDCGILQRDGYAAYKKLAGSRTADPSITLAFCWSHVRRDFYDLAKTKAPIAIETLKRIAVLYEIEERVLGKSAADRRTLRQAESKPLVADLRVSGNDRVFNEPGRNLIAAAIPSPVAAALNGEPRHYRARHPERCHRGPRGQRAPPAPGLSSVSRARSSRRACATSAHDRQERWRKRWARGTFQKPAALLVNLGRWRMVGAGRMCTQALN